VIPLIFSFFLSDPKSERTDGMPEVHMIGWRNKWLYLSSFILIGISGVLISLYPEFTDESPFILGILFATMNAATICSSLIAPRLSLQPIQTIRLASALVAIAVIGSFVAPVYGGIGGVFFLFMVVGAAAGFVFVSQMNYLAVTEKMQGTAVGLLTAASYGGMAFLPFIAGILSEYFSYAAAFFVSGFFCLLVTLTIGRCRCVLPE
jgi:MFS family permease